MNGAQTVDKVPVTLTNPQGWQCPQCGYRGQDEGVKIWLEPLQATLLLGWLGAVPEPPSTDKAL